MRSSAVRAAIVSQIEALSPDSVTGRRDVFTHLDVGVEVEVAPERAFTVKLIRQPTRSEYGTQDSYEGTWLVDLFHVAGQGVEDRVGDDYERVANAMFRLHTANADIFTAVPTPIGVAEDERQVRSSLTVMVTYRLDSSVL